MIMGCEADLPEGYVMGFNTDCDDDNPDINPGELEIPDDGEDNDCADGDETTSDGD